MSDVAGNPGSMNVVAGWLEPVRMGRNFEDEMMLTCPQGSVPERKIHNVVNRHGARSHGRSHGRPMEWAVLEVVGSKMVLTAEYSDGGTCASLTGLQGFSSSRVHLIGFISF